MLTTRRASDRGQATVEHLGAVVLVGLALAGLGALLVRAGVPQAAAVAVAATFGARAEPSGTPPARRLTPATYTAAVAAVRGDAGAYSLAGARALLAEDLGEPLADLALERIVLAEARRRHAAWFDPAALDLVHPRSPLGVHVAAAGTGEVAVRVVTPADEAVAGAPGARGGWQAALLSVGVDTIGLAAGRLHAAAGLAVEAVEVLGEAHQPAPGSLPPGERAADVVLCQRYAVRVREGGGPERMAFEGLRVGVLRAGRLIRDELVEGTECG